jgi:integrase
MVIIVSKFNFTKRALQNLPLPAAGVSVYHDKAKRGLKLTVRPTGIKTFILYRKIKGKPERIIIGRFPDLTIEQARQTADILNSKVAFGVNPNEEKRVLKTEITLGELFQRYLERHAKIFKRSWEEDEYQFKRYLERWRNKRLSSVKKSDVQKLHAEIGDKHGHYSANRLLALLHVMFSKAADWGWTLPNPAHGVKKFKELSRERFIQADELPRFFQALSEEPNQAARDYILLSLLTGARKANVLAMRWEEISFARNTWTIPITKNGEAHTVPLMQEAITILNARKELIDKSSWVFPSNSASGHLEDPKKAWLRVLAKAEISNLRLHDLRRSLGSWQAATGANLSIIGKTLAHKNVSTTAIYARLNIDPVRAAMEKATSAMLRAGGVKQEGKVIAISKIVNG